MAPGRLRAVLHDEPLRVRAGVVCDDCSRIIKLLQPLIICDYLVPTFCTLDPLNFETLVYIFFYETPHLLPSSPRPVTTTRHRGPSSRPVTTEFRARPRVIPRTRARPVYVVASGRGPSATRTARSPCSPRPAGPASRGVRAECGRRPAQCPPWGSRV